MSDTLLLRISRRIGRYDSTRLILLLFLLAVGFIWLFNLSTWHASGPQIARISGGEGLLDARLFYTAQQAQAAMSHYGQVGRALYHQFQAADFVFIPIYSLGLALLLSRLLRVRYGEGSPWMRLNLLPLGIGLFDVTENLLIHTLLVQYPHAPNLVGSLAGLATLCKYSLTMVSLLLLVFLSVRVSLPRRS